MKLRQDCKVWNRFATSEEIVKLRACLEPHHHTVMVSRDVYARLLDAAEERERLRAAIEKHKIATLEIGAWTGSLADKSLWESLIS